ncbi:hypothetical protein ACFOHT_15000 [Massilia oculi]|jgi:ABC-type uncharacterized transport system substrate-binding protein|uniref:ABC transporter substrate-binding protein n=1 Tax=Massilia oculi TaxID=945844 RepID=A0A2S2DJ61_9BURK|nr:hypothetical protein [Massilia oculi]AWL05129.1 hypothetical protein DIR46_12275 [Massilia oculi]
MAILPRRMPHQRRRAPALAPLLVLAFMLALSAGSVHAAQQVEREREEAQGYRFQILTGDDSAVTHRIADDLYKRLVPTFAAFRTELAQKRRMLYVAIGPTALRDALSRRCDCVVISAYTSSQVWRTLTARLPKQRRMAMTAIYAEPAPNDQMRLAELLYGRPVRVGVLLGPDTAFLRPVLHEATEIQMYTPGEDLNHTLNSMTRAETLLALPDSDIYNAENVRNILLSTYRRKQGVIGFSADMVKVGALATTYSEIEEINAQVAELAADFVRTGELDPPQFPRYFRTIINEGVASSLDLRVTDAARNFARRAPLPQ